MTDTRPKRPYSRRAELNDMLWDVYRHPLRWFKITDVRPPITENNLRMYVWLFNRARLAEKNPRARSRRISVSKKSGTLLVFRTYPRKMI